MAGIAIVLASAASPALADNLGGRFTACGQLVEFVAPSATDAGRFTLLGIGPGLRNEPGDEESHHFPFAPDIVLDPVLVDDLRGLAAGLSFTCLALETGANDDDVGLLLVRSIVLDRQVDLCGTVARDRLGTFSIGEDGGLHRTTLLADADRLLDDFEGSRVSGLLTESAALGDKPRVCLHLELGPDGVVESMTFTGDLLYCGKVSIGAYLLVGAIYLSPHDLLPERVHRAHRLLEALGAEACWAVEAVDSQLLSVSASGYGEVCGYAGYDEFGEIAIDEVTIPDGLLRDDEVDQLAQAAALGGDACLTVGMEGGQAFTELSVTLPPRPEGPSPTPLPTPTTSTAPVVPGMTSPSPTVQSTASPTPTPTMGPSPSPSPSRSPAATAPVAQTRNDGPWTPVLAVLLVVLVAAALYAAYRARAAERVDEARRAEPDDELDSPYDVPLLDAPTAAFPAAGWSPVAAGLSGGGHAPVADAGVAAAPALAAAPVMAGSSGADPTAARRVDGAKLTPREREVLSMLAAGLSNRRIGEALFIAESTAGVHVSNIMGKLGAATRTEAAAIAHRAGISISDDRRADQSTAPLH